VHLSLNNIW